jgi:hypothetical protein
MFETIFYIWENDFGTITIDTSEHSHYASTCLGIFHTREEAEAFVSELESYKKETKER